MTEDKIKQLQAHEQNLQGILAQKQQFQQQIVEVDTGLKEIDDTKESFKIIGNIMVKTDRERLKKELEEKKEKIRMRMNSLEKQEAQIKEKSQKLKEEVMENMKGDQNGNKKS